MKGTCAVCKKEKDVEFCECCGVSMCKPCRKSPLRLLRFLQKKAGTKQKFEELKNCLKRSVS